MKLECSFFLQRILFNKNKVFNILVNWIKNVKKMVMSVINLPECIYFLYFQ